MSWLLRHGEVEGPINNSKLGVLFPVLFHWCDLETDGSALSALLIVQGRHAHLLRPLYH
jgi:hypothetical protein